MSELDTFPKLLRARARDMGDRPSIREKDFGIWQTWTWSEVYDQVSVLAAGLAARGFGRGDKLAIIGDNRPALYWSMAAAQTLGGIPVPTYQDSVAEEMRFILDHAEARIVVAEDQEQVDKVLEIIERCSQVRLVLYDDHRGMRHYRQEFLLGIEQLKEEGREFLERNPGFIDAEIDRGKGSDTAIFLYTSGTTGTPKGVVLTHDNVLITARNGAELEGLGADDEVLAYLPMAWVGDHLFSYAQSYVTGFCVSCPESGATVMQDLREIGPTYFFAPPRIFENMLTTVMIRMEDAGIVKRSMFHYFIGVARRCGSKLLDGKSVPALDRILYAIGNVLVYGPLKNTLGLSRIRLAYTAGEAIGPEIFDFYRSLGINIKQLFGQTEAAVFITIQPNGEVDPETVGTPAPGVEIRIADNGEVLYRSPGVFVEYYKNPDATAETKSTDGWVHTGDAGYFDERGHLRIIDRAKDVGQLRDGSLFAPKFLENKLKFFPHIREAVVFGHERDFCAAMICIDLEAVGNWAERNGIAYASYQDLAARQEVYEMVDDSIEQVNRDLAADPKMAPSQIHRFLVLHKELDPDDGELTRTRKVRRSLISERYGGLIDALYSGRESCYVETQVTFEDGRIGKVAGDVRIRDVRTFDTVRKAS
jgi:long-chain acyl-CoA synthetase